MDAATAQAEIESMVDADVDPTLTETEIERLVDRARQPDRAGNSPLNVATAATWQAGTTYRIGDVIRTTLHGDRWFRVWVPGVSGATEPQWPNLANRVVNRTRVSDGSVTWEDNGTEWNPTWDLDRAAVEGWRRKAGKVAGRFRFATDGQTFDRQQLYAHCISQMHEYRRRAIGSTHTRSNRADRH